MYWSSATNKDHAGTHPRERIASFIKDEEGKVHGGIIADIKGWLHVSTGSDRRKLRRDG